jgi:hypothetical protein
MCLSVGATEGSIFNDDTIFLHSNSYLALKRCVENKMQKGHKNLQIDIRGCEDCDVNYDTYKCVKDTVLKVSVETGVTLKIRE